MTRCRRCIYFTDGFGVSHGPKDATEVYYGECRRFPPHPGQTPNGRYFPGVMSEDWCGEGQETSTYTGSYDIRTDTER